MSNESEAFFKEEVEINMNEDDEYTKINVPDFRDGRSGRFLHDFKFNQSAIIDSDAKRCFVMPLDRETVLMPRDLLDLVTKMWSGYYNIDTAVLRKNMRVITPAIEDLSSIAPRIQSECDDMKIYRLEKFVSGGKDICLIFLFEDLLNVLLFSLLFQFSSVAPN